ncbi:S10 family serine carboxypeptidase-like protein [Gallaecimonas mangrovi]|uniref:S10 family serine carboxypeptidase-like protein n=1 Tax=Gallaecimonas mangrovi TaxID=2291597 RepID=UPI0018676442|nr:peptidase S10 [Gallaecimonas mangrovi]
MTTLLLSITTAQAANFDQGEAVPSAPVVSHHSLRTHQGTLNYSAEVGRIAIRDVATGQAHGYMGYFAYRVPSKTPRPVLFVWNGGPGANSTTLQFEAAGPKIQHGQGLADNPETWLQYADLVFVDPIGTGFSRPTERRYASEFYGTVGDVASVTEFVRSWRLLHGAEQSPIYLAGESWGAGRAGSVGYALLKQGIPVAGLMLLSGGAGLHTEKVPAAEAAALKVVDLAHSAFYHGRLAKSVGSSIEAVEKAAKNWALSHYAPALANIASLSGNDKADIISGLSRFTGLPKSAIDKETLRISPRSYRSHLLPGKTLNTFDMRRTTALPELPNQAIDRYIRHDLAYVTSLPYWGLDGAKAGYAPNANYPQTPGQSWNYATAKLSATEVKAAIAKAIKDGGGPPKLGPPLPSVEEAKQLAPGLKVLVAAGSYDSLNSCTVNQALAKKWPGIAFRCYTGGHMFYLDKASRLAFNKDLAKLIKD